MLKQKNRLKNKQEFEKTFRYGSFFSSKFLIIKVKENNCPETKFGFVVGKNSFKKAVERNQIKRKLRAAVYQIQFKIKPQLNLIIGLKKGFSAKNLKTEEISRDLETALKKNNLLK